MNCFSSNTQTETCSPDLIVYLSLSDIICWSWEMLSHCSPLCLLAEMVDRLSGEQVMSFYQQQTLHFKVPYVKIGHLSNS